MKIKLTPQLAYIIGLWKARRSAEGIGIEGNRGICELFLRECLSLGLAQADKVKFIEPKAQKPRDAPEGAQMHVREKREREDCKIFFYHSAYRAYFDSVLKNELELFRYKNEYSMNFIAGIYDGNGGVGRENGLHYFFGNKADEMVLLRLGMRVKSEKKKVVFLSSADFEAFVKPALKFAKN